MTRRRQALVSWSSGKDSAWTVGAGGRFATGAERVKYRSPKTSLPRALVSWSSGKDSAWALHETVREGRLEVVGLLTTVTRSYGRVSMHGVREEILNLQAERLGLPLWKIEIPSGCSNAEYERSLGETLTRAREDGVDRIVFGDLFLEDVRAYRERTLADTGILPEFPLWKRETGPLAREMIASGLEAILVCVDPGKLSPEFAGRRFDAGLLSDLPEGVDPCGENGEFHTCVVSGPMFASRIPVQDGERVARDGFVFADLRVADGSRASKSA